MKKILPAVVLSLITMASSAQQSGRRPITISLEGGRSFSSSTLQHDVLIGNGYQLGGDIFVPVLHKGNESFSFGIVTGAQYLAAKNISPDIAYLQSKYKLPSGNLDIKNIQSGSSDSHGFTVFAGLQADCRIGKATISPALNGGYFSLTRDGYQQTSEVMVNGSSQSIILSASPDQHSTGFVVIPKLKISYSLTGNLSLYAASTLHSGPAMVTTKSYLVPAGGFNEKNTYEAQQLASGKLALDGGSKDAGHFVTSSVHIGLSWGFGGGSARRLKGKITKPGDGGKQTQGMSFGEKVNQGLHSAGSVVAQGASMVAGNPIGGIIVKGGKNPGGQLMITSTNSKGEFEFTATEDGSYLFTITAPETQPENEKKENPLYEAGGQTASNPMSGARAFVASPGSPIGGIVVKGGKNPGGSTLVITTDGNGTFQLNDIKAGNYRFVITAPAQPAKSISEKGVR